MKRFITFAAASMTALCLTACSVPMKNSAVRRNGLSGAFSGKASITLEKLQAEGDVSRTGKNEWSIEFSAPNTLSGVRLDFSEDSVSASYKGLSFSVPQSALPVKAMMLNLISAVESNSAAEELSGEEKDGNMLIKGSLEGGDYTLSVDKDGNLSGFDMPGYKLKMSFTEISGQASVPGTECTETSN